MSSNFIRIGFQNIINVDRVIAVVSPDSSPAKRMIAEAKERGAVIDASSGRKTKTVFVMDSDHIVLSALEPADIKLLDGTKLLSMSEEGEA